MAVNISQAADGGMDLEGIDGAGPGFLAAGMVYNAASVNTPFFIASRAYRVRSIRLRILGAGTDAGAVTATFTKSPSLTTPAAGTLLNSGTVNLKTAANTAIVVPLTATAADLDLVAGDAICLVLSGVMTAATGCINIFLVPR